MRPTEEQMIDLLNHYQNGRLIEAKKLAVVLTEEFPLDNFAWKVLSAVLAATGKKSEAVEANRTAVILSPKDAEAHNNLGVRLAELGRLEEAEVSYKQAIEVKSDYTDAHYNLGNALKDMGKLEKALASYKNAIALKPDYLEAHNNFGITLLELRRFEEAERSYRHALTINPNCAEVHSNLGSTLRNLGRLNESEKSLRQALKLNSEHAEALCNLGATLQEQGRLEEALASYSKAIALKPECADAYVNLARAIKNVRFKSPAPELYLPLTRLLTVGNFSHPSDVAGSILSLLKNDCLIKDLFLNRSPAASLHEITLIIESLDNFPLLHSLMRLCPLPELEFEERFVHMRSSLLKNFDKVEVTPELIYFLSTLAIHCFISEYSYAETVGETHLVGELQTDIQRTVELSGQPDIIKILCLASYRPLHQYDWCQKLKSLDNFEEVKKQLIDEPNQEKKILKNIPVLAEISDNISLKVKKQYEENPYPRWVKLHVPIKAKPIAVVCDELELKLHSENIKHVTAPLILVAGCGTGQHSIKVATRFSNCHVTAVDLSLTSLAYAQRKTYELCLDNLEYLQADILHLSKMGKSFDMIESAGVLHHMDAPMVGWRILADLLKPDGLMKVALYSDLARQHIAEVRKEIETQGVETAEPDIRKFRNSLAKSDEENHRLLTQTGDFFSLSMLRDLIFHVQEHRFTLPQIKDCLEDLGLRFCGFEHEDAICKFRKLYGKEADIYDLLLWHKFEEIYPRTFSGMYQFWCQKILP